MELNDLIEIYLRQVALAYSQKKLSQFHYDHYTRRSIRDLEELEIATHEFIRSMIYAEYYITLERIEKGEEMLAAESDEKKKSEYRKLLNELSIKLDNLRPRSESA